MLLPNVDTVPKESRVTLPPNVGTVLEVSRIIFLSEVLFHKLLG
jgi:hypothetical protein